MNKMIHKFGKSTIKNSLSREVDIPQSLDLLNKWTIPKVDTRTIYQLGTFEKLGLKQVVKTTEEAISLNNEEMFLQLLTNNDLEPYRRTDHKFVHIGLVQVAFKPLTLEGLPESFIAALRDGRNLDWKKSIMGIIKSSLAHGPVYFDVYPNLTLSLSDDNILDALTLNVKTHGYNYAQGSEIICICYRIYFKPLYTLNPCCKLADKPMNETIIIETNFHKSDITTRRKIKWEEISFPENWKIEKAMTPRPIIHTDLLDVIQTSDGTVSLNFGNNQTNKIIRSNSRRSASSSVRSFISPCDYIIDHPGSSRHSTSHTREKTKDDDESLEEPIRMDEFLLHKDNIIKGHSKKNIETMSQMSYNFND